MRKSRVKFTLKTPLKSYQQSGFKVTGKQMLRGLGEAVIEIYSGSKPKKRKRAFQAILKVFMCQYSNGMTNVAYKAYNEVIERINKLYNHNKKKR